MKAVVTILAAALVVSSAAVVAADDARPFETVRRLQDLQDGVSTGTELQPAAADESLSKFVSAISSGSTDWMDRRNRAALLFYLVTGGDPELVRPALDFLPKEVLERKVIEEALAEAASIQGGSDAALDAVDPRNLSPEVAGATALAQARSQVKRDRLAAIAKLHDARILAPGGLVEEMSLRQEAQLLRSPSELASLESIVARYFSIFSRSAYVSRFLEELESVIEAVWKEGNAEKRGSTLGALSAIPKELRAKTGLHLSRMSLVQGDRAGALVLIEATCDAPGALAGEADRCSLYHSLASNYRSLETSHMTPLIARLDTVDRLLRICASVLLDGRADKASTQHMSDMATESDDSQAARTRRAVVRIDEAEQLLRNAR